MSLMLKLLATTLLLSSFVYANSTSKKVEDFLSNEFGDNPRIQKIDIKVEEVKPIKDLKGWNAYIVNIEAILKISQKRHLNRK